MANPLKNFCYSVANKREDMEYNQENRPRRNKSKREARAAARKAHAKHLSDIKKHNIAVKMEAYRNVRRPGGDHAHLLQVLDQMLGTLEARKAVVREVVEEALRFKRRVLAQLLEEYIVEMEMNENNDRGGVCRQCARLRALGLCTCKGRNIG